MPATRHLRLLLGRRNKFLKANRRFLLSNRLINETKIGKVPNAADSGVEYPARKLTAIIGNNVPGTEHYRSCCHRPVFGLTGRWRFPEKAVGAACRDVRFQLFRTVTFDTTCLSPILTNGTNLNAVVFTHCLAYH